MNTIDFKTKIYQIVESVIANTFDSRTPSPLAYPYCNLIYPSTNELDESFRVNITLTIDIWDNITNTARIEQLADDIDAELNRFHDIQKYFRVYRLTPFRLELDESDRNIRRRQLRYQIILFNKED